MHRGLAHAAAWTCATGAAVTLSWWGVHTVMAGTAYDPPKALPLTASQETGQQASDPDSSSSTQRPKEPSGSGESDGSGESGGSGADGKAGDSPGSGDEGSRTSGEDSGGSDGSGKSGNQSGSSSPSASSSPAGDVKSYSVSGGQVVFEIHADYAELVSATPRTGWQMQIWKQPQQDWIRVTFTQGSREVSVFCTWHDHAPLVEIDDP